MKADVLCVEAGLVEERSIKAVDGSTARDTTVAEAMLSINEVMTKYMMDISS